MKEDTFSPPEDFEPSWIESQVLYQWATLIKYDIFQAHPPTLATPLWLVKFKLNLPWESNSRFLLNSFCRRNFSLTKLGVNLGLKHGKEEPDTVQVLDVVADVGVGCKVGQDSDNLKIVKIIIVTLQFNGCRLTNTICFYWTDIVLME